MLGIPIIFWVVFVFAAGMSVTIVLSLISVYIPNGATSCRTSFTSKVSYLTGTKPMSIKVAHINNDSYLDLVVANRDCSTTMILLGNGDGTFKHHLTLPSEIDAWTNGVVLGDINNDNRLDIVVVNRNTSNVGVFLGRENESFSQEIVFSTGKGSEPVSLALGDLNNDKKLDLVVTDHKNNLLLIYMGYGNGTFNKLDEHSTGNDSGPYLVIVDDFDRNHGLDIAVGNGHGKYVSIFLNDGTGSFSTLAKADTISAPLALVATDLNRDGIVDIATANRYENSSSVLLGNAGGTFRQVSTFFHGYGSLPYAINTGDFNGDKIPDLIISNSGTNSVDILLGYGNGRFRKQKTYSTGIDSEPVDVAVGDFNGDNRLDFASANRKQNTITIFLNTCL